MLIPLNRFYLAGQAGSADKTVRCQRSTSFGGKEMIKSEYRRLTDAAQRQKEKLLKKYLAISENRVYTNCQVEER